jgi:CheY-like chemotaxis protein
MTSTTQQHPDPALDKMQALSRLSAEIGVRVGRALMAILGNCNYLLSQPAVDEATRPWLEQIKESADGLAGMVHQLLVFSNRQVLPLRTLDLNGVLHGLAERIQALLGGEIDLEWRLAAATVDVAADAGQIETLVLSLARFCGAAMPHGGRLTLETQIISAADDQPAHVRLTLEHTGTGLDAKTQERLFEPYFTARDTAATDDIGLALVHGIVRQLHGTIAVDSVPLGRTRFTLTMPLVQAATSPPAAMPAPAAGAATILIVDDEDLVRGFVARVLAQHGYRVIEARYGGEAVLKCLQADNDIRLVITDMVMPHMSGRQLADNVLALKPDLKFLFMSGYTADLLGEAAPFLRKPFTAAELVNKVRTVLASEVRAAAP